jgi:aspartyl protease family protein
MKASLAALICAALSTGAMAQPGTAASGASGSAKAATTNASGGAKSVQFAGSMGSKALLVIDGQPRTLAVGESHAGVKLVSLSEGVARVERGGVVSTVRLGDAPVVVGGTPRQGGAREISITAGPGGHFVTAGAINGRSVQFMVDTGATSIAMSFNEAQRIGLDLSNAKRGMSSTANGTTDVLVLVLNTVRVGDVDVYNVPAIVMPVAMPYVLLGNTFLTRFQMRRDNDVMRLELKP